MSYSTLTQYAGLSAYDMNTATYLPLTAYNPGNGVTSVFDYAALYQADYAGASRHAVFSWHGEAGAVYSITSASDSDPRLLLVFDRDGRAIAEDDGGGVLGSDHVSFVAPYSGTYYVDAAWVQGARAGQQQVSLGILEDLGTSKVVVTGGTPRGDQLDGTAGDDDMYGMSGNDSLFGGRGNDFLDGGWGTDSAYYLGKRGEYTVAQDGGGFRVTDRVGTEGSDLLVNVERLDFSDVSVALDIDGPGGQAYRLYQAAFDRAPDKGGLGYWIAALDHGHSLDAVAQGFVASAEFTARYGAHASNESIVSQLYWNVLHRAPDQQGYGYWVDILNSHKSSLAHVLADFSESQENYAQLVGVLRNGVEFQPYG